MHAVGDRCVTISWTLWWNLSSINSWVKLTSWTIIWHLRIYDVWYVLRFMIISLLFCSDVHFFSASHSIWIGTWNCSVLPSIINCILRVASNAVSTMSLNYTNLESFLTSVAFAFAFCEFHSEMSKPKLLWFILLPCCFGTMNISSWPLLVEFFKEFECFMLALSF